MGELVRRPWAGRDGHRASAERRTPRGQVGSDGPLAGAEGLTSRGRRLVTSSSLKVQSVPSKPELLGPEKDKGQRGGKQIGRAHV